MSTQTATVKSKYVPVPIPINSANNEAKDALRSRIEQKAFELYEHDGANHGEDLLHWLKAESEVLTRVPEVQESSSWFSVNVPLKGYSAGDIQVSVEPTRAVISAKTRRSEAVDSTAESNSFLHAIFLLVKWPSAVDPSTASAYFQNDALNLTAKRGMPAESEHTDTIPNDKSR